MIYHFPDLDTLRLAITSGVVPLEISLAPAVAGQDDDGQVWLEPEAALPRKVQTGLRKLGVESVKAEGGFQAEKVYCWPQMLPLQREAAPPVPTPTTPVLFELPDAEMLPDLVAEILRLGNDRQSFRFLKDSVGSRVLLRVVGPPYYSLLRALERESDGKTPVAYLERAPGTWIELGYTHPLVERFKPTRGQLVLMRPPRSWTLIDDAPFQDIYEILDFTLPAAAVSWKETKDSTRLKVPLRLGPSSSTDRPELWVLREQAVERLNALVQEAKEDQVVHRLAFAVFQSEGQTVVALRVRPSKQAPPEVVLEGAQKFRPYAKMPNLFLPCNRELRPPLRRDRVRQLLAPDPDLVTWLWPSEDGSFVPEGLPDTAFRPLSDWVDYILDRDREAVQAWIQAATFDFQSFLCSEDDKPEAPKPPPRERKGGPRSTKDEPAPPPTEETPEAQAPKKTRRKDATNEFVLPQEKPNELKQRLVAMENQFIEHEGPLDSETRQALWPEMATLHTALDQRPDAAVCWLNAMWESDTPPREWAGLWLRAEHMTPADVNGKTIDRLIGIEDPTTQDFRVLVVCILAATALGTAADVLGPRLSRIQQFLEKHEARIGTNLRAVWLAWVNLVRLSSGDVLGLARTRDRLLERLLTKGLDAEQDLPTFLRFAGQKSSERYRAVREHVLKLRDLAQHWIDLSYAGADTSAVKSAHEYTSAYADLTFAFGLARLGETSNARRLQERAAAVLSKRDEIHNFLLRAYTYRIQQVMEGKAHAGPLPAEQLEHLAQISQKTNPDGKINHFDAFVINSLRECSRILEPQEKVDKHRHMLALSDLSRELLRLAQGDDRPQMAQRLTQLLKGKRTPDELAEVFKTALEVAPRISEAFAVDLLVQLGKAFDAWGSVDNAIQLEHRATLLERGLFLAAHFDQSALVQAMVARLVELIKSRSGEEPHRLFDSLIGQSFRGLRKLGLRDECDRLLQQLAGLVTEGKTLAQLRAKHDKKWGDVLRQLLQIAGGWLFFGRSEKALPTLAEARDLIYSGKLLEDRLLPAHTNLSCSYAAALGQAPVDLALHHLAELFQKLGPLLDQFFTKVYYSRAQLQVVESVVLAIVSDDFALSHGARRWLDEDEYLVRRRIHRDLRALMTQSGL